jgi:hypothetical protein
VKTSQLLSVVQLNESARSVVDSAFQLHLLGLNARVLATQLGARARGFGVLSAEWVIISATLSELMARLEEVSGQLLAVQSREVMRERRQYLLDRAIGAAAQVRPDVRNYRHDFVLARKGKRQEFDGVRGKLRDLVAEATRAGMSGLVIARSAKIEAVSAGASAPTLTQLATDFETNLGEVMPSLLKLKKLEERGLR